MTIRAMKRPSDFLVSTQRIRTKFLVGIPFLDAASTIELRTQFCTSVCFDCRMADNSSEFRFLELASARPFRAA